MTVSPHDLLVRRRRQLRRAGGLALVVHAAVLGPAVLIVHRWQVPLIPDEISVDTIEVPPEASEPPPVPLVGPPPPEAPPPPLPRLPEEIVVDQKGDGQSPTTPTRYIANDDANPAREASAAPGSVPAPHPQPSSGRTAIPGPPRRALAAAIEPPPLPAALAEPHHADAHARSGDALAASADADGTLPRGSGVTLTPVTPAAAPQPDPAQAPSMAQASDPVATVGVGHDGEELSDLPVGNDPVVRARRSALAAFLNEVRGRVRQHWRPSEVYRRADPTMGTLTGPGRQTVLRVRLRANGSIESAGVESGSGIPELDDEAMESFGRSQPFSRPPPEVLDAGSGLSFRFGFYLDTAVASYLAGLGRAIREQWRPRPAYRLFISFDRMTVLRVFLTFDGVVARAQVVMPSGLDFLDDSALQVVKPGLHLARPPAALGEVAGLVPVRAVFLHNVRTPNAVRVVRDHSEVQP